MKIKFPKWNYFNNIGNAIYKCLKCWKVHMVKIFYLEEVRFNGKIGWKNCSKSENAKSCWLYFYAKDIIHHEFVREKHTVNGKFYEEVIKRIREWSLEFITLALSFRKVGPGIFCKTMNQVILWRYLRGLAKRGTLAFSHPPYTRDLALAKN